MERNPSFRVWQSEISNLTKEIPELSGHELTNKMDDLYQEILKDDELSKEQKNALASSMWTLAGIHSNREFRDKNNAGNHWAGFPYQAVPQISYEEWLKKGRHLRNPSFRVWQSELSHLAQEFEKLNEDEHYPDDIYAFSNKRIKQILDEINHDDELTKVEKNDLGRAAILIVPKYNNRKNLEHRFGTEEGVPMLPSISYEEWKRRGGHFRNPHSLKYIGYGVIAILLIRFIVKKDFL